MTAWSILTANSVAPVGSDAWAHLNAQQAGSDCPATAIQSIAATVSTSAATASVSSVSVSGRNGNIAAENITVADQANCEC